MAERHPYVDKVLREEYTKICRLGWNDLPEYDPNATDDTLKRHWFHLALVNPWVGYADRVITSDIGGTETRVMYEDGYDIDMEMENGGTMAILYPHKYVEDDGFDDKTIFVKNPSRLHTFPVKLVDFYLLLFEARMFYLAKDGQRKYHGCKEMRETGAMSACGGCKLVFYCSKDCQVHAWKTGSVPDDPMAKPHKEQCKIMRDPAFRLLALMKTEPFNEPLQF